jgi:hypothetical protein
MQFAFDVNVPVAGKAVGLVYALIVLRLYVLWWAAMAWHGPGTRERWRRVTVVRRSVLTGKHSSLSAEHLAPALLPVRLESTRKLGPARQHAVCRAAGRALYLVYPACALLWFAQAMLQRHALRWHRPYLYVVGVLAFGTGEAVQTSLCAWLLVGLHRTGGKQLRLKRTVGAEEEAAAAAGTMPAVLLSGGHDAVMLVGQGSSARRPA